MLFALVYFFSIFGFWVFDFFDFQLQSVSFETGALLISMRWRFLDSLLFFMNAVNFYVPMMNIRPERPEEATNPEILGGNMTQFELKFWPRSSGCFPGSVSESSNRKLLQILDEIYYVCFGALMISIFFFRSPAASHGICGSLAGCLSASVYLYLLLPELLTAGTVRGQGG